MTAATMFTIRQARTYAGLTQKKVAEELKVHPGTYKRIEKQPGKATIEQCKRIAEITKVPYNQLIFD